MMAQKFKVETTAGKGAYLFETKAEMFRKSFDPRRKDLKRCFEPDTIWPREPCNEVHPCPKHGEWIKVCEFTLKREQMEEFLDHLTDVEIRREA